MINNKELHNLRKYIDGKDIMKLKASAEKADALEKRFRNRMNRYYSELDEKIKTSLMIYGSMEYVDFDITEILMLQSFEVMSESIKVTRKEIPEVVEPKKESKMAKHKTRKKAPPKTKTPTTFAELMRRWDEWKVKKTPTKRVKSIADKIRKDYLKKTQEVWKRSASAFLKGGIQQKQEIIAEIQQAGQTTYSRAKTIVETENTYYYNQTRKNIYDKSPDVTHYLFVAIRDMATTKWCKTRNGIVYEKGTVYLDSETPPCHWNCRSELLPLSKHNPVHLKLIMDFSKHRANRNPEPLPLGWKAA